MFEIISYDPKYKDDMIFCLLQAKDALGRIPKLNDDLLDIEGNYLSIGELFLLAIDDNDRVIGMIGTKTVSKDEMWLKRFYVKYNQQRKGIGNSLLKLVLEVAKSKKITKIHTRFSTDYLTAYSFYISKGFKESEEINNVKHLILEI